MGFLSLSLCAQEAIVFRKHTLTVLQASTIDMGGKDVLLEFRQLAGPLGKGRELKILNFTPSRDKFVLAGDIHAEESLEFIHFYSDSGSKKFGPTRLVEQDGKYSLEPDEPESIGWLSGTGGAIAALLLLFGVWASNRARGKKA